MPTPADRLKPAPSQNADVAVCGVLRKDVWHIRIQQLIARKDLIVVKLLRCFSFY
jgi:hypothetical protein